MEDPPHPARGSEWPLTDKMNATTFLANAGCKISHKEIGDIPALHFRLLAITDQLMQMGLFCPRLGL